MYFDFEIFSSQYKVITNIAFKGNIIALKPLLNLFTNVLLFNLLAQLDVIKQLIRNKSLKLLLNNFFLFINLEHDLEYNIKN